MSFLSNRRYFCISYPLQVAALCCVLVPFLRYNNLLEWDFPGHFAAIWHVRYHLLPWPSGWNPFFYCGYPQGIFYPPLAHYLAALLSFPIGIAGAIKILYALSILPLPAVFYLFSRRWGLDDFRAAICSSWMTAILFLCGEMFGAQPFGSDLKSMLNVGLFANTLSLPVLFLFLSCCGCQDLERRWKAPAALIGILFLLHPLSALIAVVILVSLLICRLMPGPSFGRLRALLNILTGGLLIGGLWLLPYLRHRSLMNAESFESQWPPILQLLIINGIILALSCFSKEHLKPLAITFVVLSNFILLGSIAQLELQFSRLTIYLLFLLPIFPLTWLKSNFLLSFTGFLAVAVGTYGYHSSGIHPKGVADFPLVNFGKVEGRILSVAPPSHLPSYHVQHDLIPVKTGNQSILGLFIESSLNGRYLGDLTRILDPDAHVWGTSTEAVGPDVLKDRYAEYVKDRLRLFGISHIYTDLRLENILGPDLAGTKQFINSYPAPKLRDPREIEQLRTRYHLRNNLLDFYLYPVAEGSLTDALPYMPQNPGSDWKTTNTIWFIQTKGVPVFTDKPAPLSARPAKPGEWVEVLQSAANQDRLELQIHAQEDIPVLVRIGYSPDWRLTINGKESAVYRASPSLILIFGKGRAVLEYRRSWAELGGYFLSLCGLAFLVFSGRLSPIRKPA